MSQNRTKTESLIQFVASVSWPKTTAHLSLWFMTRAAMGAFIWVGAMNLLLSIAVLWASSAAINVETWAETNFFIALFGAAIQTAFSVKKLDVVFKTSSN